MTVIRRMDMAWQAPRVSTLVRLVTIPARKQVALPCALYPIFFMKNYPTPKFLDIYQTVILSFSERPRVGMVQDGMCGSPFSYSRSPFTCSGRRGKDGMGEREKETFRWRGKMG